MQRSQRLDCANTPVLSLPRCAIRREVSSEKMADELELPHIPAGDHPLGKWVAIFTAIVATMGGVVGHEASHIANEAILYKNQAVLKKTDASNQWAYYQAVSTKSHLMELAKELTPAQSHSGYEEKLAKYAQQKDEIQQRANALDSLIG